MKGWYANVFSVLCLFSLIQQISLAEMAVLVVVDGESFNIRSLEGSFFYLWFGSAALTNRRSALVKTLYSRCACHIHKFALFVCNRYLLAMEIRELMEKETYRNG